MIGCLLYDDQPPAQLQSLATALLWVGGVVFFTPEIYSGFRLEPQLQRALASARDHVRPSATFKENLIEFGLIAAFIGWPAGFALLVQIGRNSDPPPGWIDPVLMLWGAIAVVPLLVLLLWFSFYEIPRAAVEDYRAWRQLREAGYRRKRTSLGTRLRRLRPSFNKAHVSLSYWYVVTAVAFVTAWAWQDTYPDSHAATVAWSITLMAASILMWWVLALILGATSNSGPRALERVAVYFGVYCATIAEVVGDCHLLDDITRSRWPRPADEATLFADEDLRIASANSHMWPALPCGPSAGTGWVLRVSDSAERDKSSQVKNDIATAPRSATDTWVAAESAVCTLTSSRPTIEYTDSPPAVLRWLAPGVPIAFGTQPW